MSAKTLLIVRGLPSSGKSSFGTLVADTLVSADDFPGLYEDGFNPSLLPQAHAWCQRTIRESLITQPNRPIVAVANTFSQRWEMEPYLVIASELGARSYVVDLFDAGLSDAELEARNTHGVPLTGIQAMRGRWEHDWKIGNPVPPWLR